MKWQKLKDGRLAKYLLGIADGFIEALLPKHREIRNANSDHNEQGKHGEAQIPQPHDKFELPWFGVLQQAGKGKDLQEGRNSGIRAKALITEANMVCTYHEKIKNDGNKR